MSSLPHSSARQRTAEQQTAFASLRALTRPFRFRVVADVEGFPVIPGRVGQVEYYDGVNLAIYTDRPRLFPKLWAIPGVRRWQTGDREMRALVPVEALEQVAGVNGGRPPEGRRHGVQRDFPAPRGHPTG